MEQLRDLGITGWHFIAFVAIIAVSWVSLCHGQWPWQGIITVKKCDCCKKKK